MIVLTSLQRDFLDRYYTEYMTLTPGYAHTVAGQHGFTSTHFNRLEAAHYRSWGLDWGNWNGQIYPPLSPQPDPPIFPWGSVSELETQLQQERAELNNESPEPTAAEAAYIRSACYWLRHGAQQVDLRLNIPEVREMLISLGGESDGPQPFLPFPWHSLDHFKRRFNCLAGRAATAS